MNKEEAYNAMIAGNKITNMYFTNDEYLHYNLNTYRIETEKGYYMSNYWDKNYLPNVKWQIKG